MPQDKEMEVPPERAAKIFEMTQHVFNMLKKSDLYPAEATMAIGMTAKALVLSSLSQANVSREVAIENARRALIDGFNQEFDVPPNKKH